MIGNDIVDLALAEKDSNWKRKGFLDKIFTSYEQSLILNAIKQEKMVWNLWSRKEAAYKIYNRETGIRGFFPLQIQCNYYSEENGIVAITNKLYHTLTETATDFIYTIAVSEEKNFKNIQNLDTRNQITKINGIPFFLESSSNDSKPVSISHHGRFERIITLKTII